MGDVLNQILSKLIKLADQVSKSVDDARSFKEDCRGLKSKTEKLSALLRQASKSSSDLFERPTLRIIKETEKTLCKSLSLVKKCRRGGNGCISHIFIIIPATDFRKMSSQLDISIGDVSWLLRVSISSDDEYVGIPSIAQNEPILCLIWKQIHTLCKGSLDDRSDAAASLVSLARDHDRYGKIIVDEGGIEPLLKLMIEGQMEGQERAAEAIGLLGRDAESVEKMIHAGACSVFAKILKEGTMKLQQTVCWAILEFVANHPKCQDHFAQNETIQLLVNHLDFEYEDPATKASMSAKALRHLSKGNSGICRSITESGGLLRFAVLLEKCPDERVQFDSAIALMEIAAVAEKDKELRCSAFNPDTPAAKAVFDQLLRIIEQADSDLLLPCIMTMGYLARSITATSTRIIRLLVKLLQDEDGEADVQRATAIALSKFVCTGNSFHLKHSKAIISEGGVKHLIWLVYFGERILQISALIPLSYIALHLPDSEELAEADVLKVLQWSSKQHHIIRNPTVETLLPEAISRMVHYLSRRNKGFH